MKDCGIQKIIKIPLYIAKIYKLHFKLQFPLFTSKIFPKEQSFQRFLSKFVKIRVHNRVQSYILAHPSKRSFEDFTVTLQPRDPENSLKKKREKKPPLPLLEKSPNPIQFYRSSIREKKNFPECLEPSIPRQSSAIVRHITRARIKR